MSTRDQYRETQQRRFLTVTVQTADGVQVDGLVDNLSASGAGAAFPLKPAPYLELGDKVELEFKALVLLRLLRVAAVVRRVDERPNDRHYAFEFVDPDAVMRLVPYTLLREFNRRSCRRLELEGPVELLVGKEGEQTLTASLADLSASGVGLRMSPKQGSSIETGDPVEVRFSLSESPSDFRLAGAVRSQRTAGEDLLIGVEFDDQRTDSFETQSDEIQALILRCLDDSRPQQKP